jgi:DNA modification methylase
MKKKAASAAPALVLGVAKLLPIDSIEPHPENPRDSDLGAIIESIKANGFYGRVLCQERGKGEKPRIIVGEHRWRAAKEVGLKQVPVEIVEVSDAAARRIMLVDNRTQDLASWDESLLAALLKDMAGAGVDGLIGTGYDGDALDGLLRETQEQGNADAEPQIDRAAELQKKWHTKLGQLWQIGEHRLLCGDATNAGDVARVLKGVAPFLMVTDPPYGVEYDPSWRMEEAAKGHLSFAARRVRGVENDDRFDWSAAWHLFPGDVFYCWHAGRFASSVQTSMETAGFEIRGQIIWAKSNFPISRGHYHWRHEPCWYGVRKGSSARWAGDRTQTTLWEIDLDKNCEGGHATQKPLECMARPIRNHGLAGDVVYDPFLGSGTTMVACQNLGRKCRAIEISPPYVAVALERMATAFPGIEIKQVKS